MTKQRRPNPFEKPLFQGWRETKDGEYRVKKESPAIYSVWEANRDPMGKSFVFAERYFASNYRQALEKHTVI